MNIPIYNLKRIDELVGEGKLFPSRSDFYRAAALDYIRTMIETMKMPKMVDPPSMSVVAELSPPKTLTPVCTIDEDGREHYYKIIKK